MKKVFAHEEVVHETTAESAFHYLDFFVSPIGSIITFFAVVFVSIFLLNKAHMKQPNILLVVVGLHIIGGVVGFIFIPQLGVVAVSLGFILSLLSVFVGIKSNQSLK